MPVSVITTDYHLKFRFPFKIAAGVRSHTPSVFVKLSDNNISGYGEATLPPYLKETQQTVQDFITGFFKADIETIDDCYRKAVDVSMSPSVNMPALAAIEMACLQVISKRDRTAITDLLKINGNKIPDCTFTIGMDDEKTILEKLKAADPFNILKVKLGGENDLEIVETICSATSKPICIDANQGWKNYKYAAEMLDALKNYPVQFVEQPLPKELHSDMLQLKKTSHLPLIADESFQTISELHAIAEMFDGINIKLMKCGGVTIGRQIIDKAKELNLKILIGCMSESSCGIAAAVQLAPLADWADLDGPLLISNDPFNGIIYKNGKVYLEKEGLTLKNDVRLF